MYASAKIVFNTMMDQKIKQTEEKKNHIKQYLISGLLTLLVTGTAASLFLLSGKKLPFLRKQ